MTIRYLDIEDGNDSNGGLSFATRKKTISSVTTGAAAGDVIRVMASPGPNDIGSCTWADNSRNITIPAGLVKLIDDCATAWTVSTNVTAVAPTANRKSSTASAGVNVLTAFTTGKAAYRTLAAPLDLSAFSFVAAWVDPTFAFPIGSVVLQLCSDTTGDVPVVTIPLDDGQVTSTGNIWAIAYKDNGGSPLPSNVNSIAIFVNTDISTSSNCQLNFNNIVASKGKNDPQHLSIISLIGKKTTAEPEWYPLQSLSDTQAVIGAHRQAQENTSTPRPYRGVSETVDTYAIRPTILACTVAQRTMATVSGVSGNPIIMSGGWSRTDMSAQSGQTWISGTGRYTNAITQSAAGSFWEFDNLGFVCIGGPPISAIPGIFCTYNILGVLGCDTPFADPSGLTADSLTTVNINQVWGHSSAFTWPGTSCTPLKASITRIHGQAGSTGSAAYGNTLDYNDRVDLRVGMIDNNSGVGFQPPVSTARGKLQGTTFKNNVTADVNVGSSSSGATLHRCTFLSTTKYSLAGRGDTQLIFSCEGGDPTINSTVRRHFVFATDTVTRHSVGMSWKLTLTANVLDESVTLPVDVTLAEIAVKANLPVTITVWMQRDSTSLTAGLRVADNWLDGVADTRAAMTVGTGTWEQVTLTFTPTEAGVIPIFGFAYGALNSAWFDDMAVSQ